MKTAIIFCSKHGATEKIAHLISDKIKEQNIKVLDLEKYDYPDLKQFDLIIIGGSVYYGQIQKKISKFCSDNLHQLSSKKIALFISCLTKEKEQEEFENAFPEILRKKSVANGLLGGEIIYSKLGFLEKMAVRFVAKISDDVHEINYKAIDYFVDKLNEQINSTKQTSDVSQFS